MANRSGAQHTPTPWKAVKARTMIHIMGKSPVCSISTSANHVHEDYPGCKRDYVARQEANAAFIVKAANCHADLLEALEAFDHWWNDTFPRALIERGVTGVEIGPKTNAMLDLVRAAILKAKGGSHE